MNYNKLKAKIVEAVPEIMELKFGCEVITKKWSFQYPEVIITCEIGGSNPREFYVSNRNETLYFDDIDEILGRPITLEDVFLAVQRGKNRPIIDNLRISWIKQLVIKWDMGKNLSEQSKPTIEFLYNLLVKE